MNRLPTRYFESIYASEPDPWGFASRWYETRKYAITLASLPREQYARGFEPGCANGVLTALLAPRCARLLATDVVPACVERARAHTRLLGNVDVREMAIPDVWPEERFDLVVLSEVLYYLSPAGLAEVLARLDASLAPGGHVISVHWTGRTNYPMTGADVEARLAAHPRWTRLTRHVDPSFLLSVHERRES
jgi:trans-aconitate methyltransferase